MPSDRAEIRIPGEGAKVIQRYAAGHEDNGMAYFYPCVPDGGGNVVLHADHLREVERLRGLLREWRKGSFNHSACEAFGDGDEPCNLCKRTDAELEVMAEYEYTTTQNARKGYPNPPEGEGWEEVDEKFERFDYYEVRTWRRKLVVDAELGEK